MPFLTLFNLVLLCVLKSASGVIICDPTIGFAEHYSKLYNFNCAFKNVSWSNIEEITADADYSVSLDLSYNNFVLPNSDSSSTKLLIDYGFNKFRNIHEALNLSNNELSLINKKAFKYKDNDVAMEVITLDLSNNLLDEFPYEQIYELPKLKILYLSGNIQLTKLDFSFNQLTSKQHQLAELSHLYLNRCNISYVNDNLFHLNLLKSLTYLDISENNIIKINPAIGNILSRNSYSFINMASNPLTCDCNTLWLKKFYSTRFSQKYQEPTCVDLTQMAQVNLRQLSDDKFLCPIEIQKIFLLKDQKDSISLICNVKAFPQPRIWWTYGSRSLLRLDDNNMKEKYATNEKILNHNVSTNESFTNDYYLISSTLIINSLSIKDSGNYKCSASYESIQSLDTLYLNRTDSTEIEIDFSRENGIRLINDNSVESLNASLIQDGGADDGPFGQFNKMPQRILFAALMIFLGLLLSVTIFFLLIYIIYVKCCKKSKITVEDDYEATREYKFVVREHTNLPLEEQRMQKYSYAFMRASEDVSIDDDVVSTVNTSVNQSKFNGYSPVAANDSTLTSPSLLTPDDSFRYYQLDISEELGDEVILDYTDPPMINLRKPNQV